MSTISIAVLFNHKIQLKTNFYLKISKGRTLSVLSSTQVQFDPDLPAAHELRRWYLEEGMNIEMIDLAIQPNNHENGFIVLFSVDFQLFFLSI